MTPHPWPELKRYENKITRKLAKGKTPKPEHVEQIRSLFAQCETAPDADEALCYQGAKAIIAELDGDIDTAIKYREIEAKLIERLYQLEEENPTGGLTLQDYQEEDIARRARILKRLRSRC